MADVMERDHSRDRSRRDRERAPRFSESSRDRSRDRSGGGGRGQSKSSSCRVYVSNVPYEYRWQDLKDLFRSKVGDVSFVEIFVDEKEMSRGCGIVEFANEDLVKKCLEVMQRYDVKGRKLVVKEDGGNNRDKHGNLINSASAKRIGRDDRYVPDRYDTYDDMRVAEPSKDKWGNTYGLSAHFLESLHIDSPLCNRVFVANLEYNVDEKKLKEVFRLAGHIWNVDLHVGKDGHSRGFAVVEYDHPVEAVQAISMFHNQMLNDRPMTVRMDRANELFKLPEGLKSVGMGLGANGEPLRDIARNLPSAATESGNRANKINPPDQSTNGAVANMIPANLVAGNFNPIANVQALQVASALNCLGGQANDPAAALSAQSLLQAANLTSLLTNNRLGGNLSALAGNLGGGGGGGSGGGGAAGGFTPQLGGFGSNSARTTSVGASGGGGGDVDQMRGSYGGGSGGMQSLSRDSGMGYKSVAEPPVLDNPISNSQMNRSNITRNDNVNVGIPGLKEPPVGMSRKVLVSNLPPTVNFKMLNEKFEEYGNVLHVEQKGTGSVLIVYSSDWQAMRAIQNLDRARIDGKTIEAQFYF